MKRRAKIVELPKSGPGPLFWLFAVLASLYIAAIVTLVTQPNPPEPKIKKFSSVYTLTLDANGNPLLTRQP